MLAVSLAGALSLARCWWQPARAANPPVDAGLLEFLGSVDSDDEDWHQYLGDTHGAASPRPVHGEPVDPPADRAAGNSADPAGKPSGSSSTPGNDPPVQQSAPKPSQPSSSSGSNGQSSPPGVNHT